METKNLFPAKRHTENFLLPFETMERGFDELPEFPISGRLPPLDLKETEKEFVLSVELPGVDKKDIRLDIAEDAVSLECERREEKEESGKEGYHFKEQRYGRIFRSFPLPAPVKASAAKAAYKNGVLKITLPKQRPSRVRRIDIE